MYKVGDYVSYGSLGVYKIVEIAHRELFGKINDYFVMHSVFGNDSSVYVPVNNKELGAKMKAVISADDTYDLIKKMPDIEIEWIEDKRERNDKYTNIIENGDRFELAKLIKSIYLHKKELEGNKKKLYIADEKIIDRAEKVLYEQMAHALNIEPNEVVSFLADFLKKK